MNAVISIDSAAQAHVQAYLEYKNIVGDTDGGKLLSEEEYAKRKKKALQDQKNRVYVTWLNSNHLECRAVGPSSKCFCGHKFRDHDSCNKNKKIYCKMSKCKCRLFEYIPIRGSQDLKCHCKHSYKLHNISTRKCTKKHITKGICQCHGFISSFGCACGQPFSSHFTLFETREERKKSGKRVENLAMGTGMGCAAMGGITTFSSLLDGIDRMSVEQNKPPISPLQWQFIKPKTKLSEEEEMAIYARKYENKSQNQYLNYKQIDPMMQIGQSNALKNIQNNPATGPINKPVGMRTKLKLLKKKRKKNKMKHSEDLIIVNKQQNVNPANNNSFNHCAKQEIQQKIFQIEQQLRNPKLSQAKKYALNKTLKIERSKIIRHRRKSEQERRRYEAGL